MIQCRLKYNLNPLENTLDIFAFFGSVWLAIFAGLFLISMIVGCTFDRRGNESVKWWVFWLGIIGYTLYQYNQGATDWKSGLYNVGLWKFLGIYIAIGLGYSILEFMLEVRRSVRRLKKAWGEYKTKYAGRATRKFVDKDDAPVDDDAEVANSFVAEHSRWRHQIIGVKLNRERQPGEDLILPEIDRGELAQSVACWTIFWPFYAVSLIIGDLVYEAARIVADIMAKISGRFVKMAFRGAFK